MHVGAHRLHLLPSPAQTAHRRRWDPHRRCAPLLATKEFSKMLKCEISGAGTQAHLRVLPHAAIYVVSERYNTCIM